MFGAFFRQAQATVESSVGYAVDRASMVVPFIIAAAFAVAALCLKLTRELGGELGMLVMAVLFVVIGLIVTAVQAARGSRAAVDPQPSIEAAPNVNPPSLESGQPASLSSVDKELLAAMAGAIGPAAIPQLVPMVLPRLISLLLRNLPLVAAIGVAMFVLSRDSAGPQGTSGERPADGIGGSEGFAAAE